MTACFVGIAVGRLPVLRMNRATIALVGAVLVILVGGVTLPEAFASLDLGTLALLFAVMILSVNLSYSGFFKAVAYRITRHARTRRQLLALVVVSSGVLSAVFLNDTICLMLTPLVIEVRRARKLDPIPYLIALALSANIGSAATVIGNPQNILIGAVSGVGFFHFVVRMIVPVTASLAIVWLLVLLVHRSEFAVNELTMAEPAPPRVYRPLLIKSLIGSGLMLLGIIIGMPTTLSALSAAAFLLVTRRIKPERVLRDVDWTLLVFFGSLFILTASIRSIDAYQGFVSHLSRLMSGNYFAFSALSALFSNLISNVPAVMLLRRVIEGFADPHPWWLLLSMATTFAGNLTLLGSVANLIVAEGARRHGIHLGFKAHLRVGIPVTLTTLAVGTTWLLLT